MRQVAEAGIGGDARRGSVGGAEQVLRLLDADHLPLNVVGAAHERLARFEAALLAGFEAENGDDAVVEASRPKLTLCVAGA